jgi:cytochrome c-type biogenesis protein CcmE
MQRKFIIGGVLILAAIVYLIVSSSQANAQYFLTVNELKAKSAQMTGKEVRISGAVIGETIQYNPANLDLTFEVVQIPGDNKVIDKMGGLAAVLHQAVLDTSLQRIKVIYNGPKPDLLKNEAQAIMTGTLDSAGVFHANELLLKCPTRYDEAVPEQAVK